MRAKDEFCIIIQRGGIIIDNKNSERNGIAFITVEIIQSLSTPQTFLLLLSICFAMTAYGFELRIATHD